MTDRRFPDVPGGYPFPALELETLDFWRRERIFARSLEQTAGGRPFVFFEGPPTANNVPHVGHVLTRVVKDLFPRYRTMLGDHVARKAGWDTHGLPVEIEVEKSLGFSGKEQIEAYGIARFNQACLDSVHTYERQWRTMTERVGYWVDLDQPYLTYTNEYVESLWWALATLWRKDLLGQSYKIQPYCARCGTTLSSHEVAQNYKDADDPSVWIAFPALPNQERFTVEGDPFVFGPQVRFVAWTTTPWTLIANVALAIHPDLTYRLVADPRPTAPEGSLLLFGDQLGTAVPCVVERDGKRETLDLRTLPAVARFRGLDLAGLRYQRPFTVQADIRHTGDEVPHVEGEENHTPHVHQRNWSDRTGWPLLAATYVTATDGTGLVHTAPMYGEDDHATGEKHGLPGIFSVGLDGNIVAKPGLEAFAGMWFKDADPKIVKDLDQRGFLLHAARTTHSYPFCWRCDRPLLYYAHLGWFIRTTRVARAMVEKNRTIGWHPEHVGEGRFGNWLENVVDWALSRKRYWGTPLPIWECDRCGHHDVVGSFEELFARAGRPLPEDRSKLYDRGFFDPHRPFVDRDAPAEPFTWACSATVGGRPCNGTMGRITDVADAWFDSGAMPFAQHHYPFENRERFAAQFPADFISEAVDQTRGWFYTLHALAVLLFDDVAYRHCIVLGHVNDEQGRKMSKRLKNVVEPMGVIAEAGADPLRWYFYLNNPEQPSRFSARLVREAAQRFLLPTWNALSFFSIYANLDGWHPGNQPAIPFAERPALDRWVLLRLDRTARTVSAQLDTYTISEAARALQELVDELTNWYIRRSRGRFWAGTAPSAAAARDKESAYQTLYEVLTTLARLLAPFVPFFAESLHRHLVRSQDPQAPLSVHLERWPAVPERAADAADHAAHERLLAAMAAVQRIVSLGHAARQTHALKTRQPLAAVTLVTADPELPALVTPYLDILAEELNVKAIQWAEDRTAYVHHKVTPVFPKLGPRFGKRMPLVKQALLAADGDALAHELESTGRITVTVEGEAIALHNEEVDIQLEERAGVATQGDRELLVALDTALSPALVAEGLAREVVHRIQAARKDQDLDYADRIRVRYQASGALAEAIATHREWIAGETLALELSAADDAETAAGLTAAAVDEHPFALAVERIG
jgi:isoleucyl-tRNA synthetase